jgi:NAD(P)H-hydrate repair Nnr-like enzyme with NAD(P)H-hydrate dehydratase domain
MCIDVLRQLKREVDEENRLRLLMVPVQRAMHDFETRVMKAVEQAFTVGFERPDLIQEDKLASLQASLNNAVTDNWDTFVANHSKSLVMDTFLLKHYLNINYACKNDPLVMTLHKGELERRSGVLNKYTQRFFVLTECKTNYKCILVN